MLASTYPPVMAQVATMDNGSTNLEDLTRTVAASEYAVWAGALLSREGDKWTARYLQLVVGPPPSGWAAQDWAFDNLAFVSDELTHNEVSAALQPHPAALRVGRFHAELPGFQTNSTWTDYASRHVHDPAPLDWPTRDFTLYKSSTDQWQPPQSYLIGDQNPSFTTFDAAYRAFFYGDFSTPSQVRSISELAKLRLLQTRARIQHVHIGPASLVVDVDGSEAAGCKLEVIGSTWRASQIVGDIGQVHFELPGGLPDDAWLFLSREHRWLDDRAIGSGLPFKGDLSKAGVEVEPSQDFESEAEALIAAGENEQVEYKLRVPDARDGEAKRRVFKTVAAFANGHGGTILFGVDDDMVPVGLEGIAREEARLNDLVRAIVTPDPGFKTQQVTIDGKQILLLRVDPGSESPYGVRLGSSEHVQFYIRRNGSSYPATQGEIRALARADVSAVTGLHGGPYFGPGGIG
jgi:hypothetical protein